MPETTTAAAEIYNQYANRKDLTVALIGDYQGYNAVMLRAQNAEGWLWLCEEFGVDKKVDAGALDSTRVTSITTASTTLDSGGLYGGCDTLQLPGNPVGEYFAGMMDSLAGMVASGNIPYGNITMDTAYSVSHRQHWENGTLVSESLDTMAGAAIPPSQGRLLRTAADHDKSGYLVYDDSDALTLWLFFYSTKDEMAQIIDNVISKRELSQQGAR